MRAKRDNDNDWPLRYLMTDVRQVAACSTQDVNPSAPVQHTGRATQLQSNLGEGRQPAGSAKRSEMCY